MSVRSVRPIHRILLPSLLLLIPLYLLFPAQTAAGESGFYEQSLSALSAHDSTRAVACLDSALAQNERDWSARLRRAELRLAAGRAEEAEADYNYLLNSESSVIRSQAHLGLGRVLLGLPDKKMVAVKEYKLAVMVDPLNPEALYELAQLGFELGEATGFEIADNTLADLVLLDPDYRGAYSQWRQKIKGHSLDNLRKVDSSLPGYIQANPKKGHLWLDIARDRFELFETGDCLEALDSLERFAPGYKLQDRLLLRARCFLDQEQPDSFESLYNQALAAAEHSGDFSTLQREAEVIFVPREQESFSRLRSAAEKAAFFRVFWLNKDFDPTTAHNERLLEHYRRLRTAQKKYSILAPDGLINTSEDYLRLLSLEERTTVSVEESARGKMVLYDYNPVQVFGDRGMEMGLDHRGLVYVRHGPPDFINFRYINERKDGFVAQFGATNAEEWYYWPNKIVFKSGLGTGGFLFWPDKDESEVGIADIQHAMQTQTFTDPLPVLKLEHYSAAFLADNGATDLEYFSSAPAEQTKTDSLPLARLVLFDRSLNEKTRDSVTVVPVRVAGQNEWLAVNHLTVKPGAYSCAVALDLAGRRAAATGNLHIGRLRGDSLCVSGIILGDPPQPELSVRSRGVAHVLPRPSRSFSPQERVSVYCEIYGLAPADSSGRDYHEKVTVSLVEERKSLLKSVLTGGKKRVGSLSMSFERSAGTTAGAAAEQFEIDAVQLKPGKYNLVIEVQERQDGPLARTESQFTVE